MVYHVMISSWLIFLSILLGGVLVTASPILTGNSDTFTNAIISDESSDSTSKDKIKRLSDDVVPQFYDLRIVPFLQDDFKFNGEVQILLLGQAYSGTNEIVLHSEDLQITMVQLQRYSRTTPITYTLDSDNQLLVIKTDNRILSGQKYLLKIQFNGKLRDDMTGFYRSSYQDSTGTKWLATTQFEATYARRAFPCFDEPKFKARYRIRVARLPSQVAVSNMPIESSSTQTNNYLSAKDRVWDSFRVSPFMSSYLVAFIVSEFEHKTDTIGKTDINVWARPDFIDISQYILQKSKKILQQLNEFTNIEYNLPKLDLAAIPDFKAGAMENFGLTTYREMYVLCDETKSSQRNLEVATQIVAHEFAHQWFGDYITPKWWDHLWLNEGFATYFQYRITAEVEPTWRVMEQFVVDELQPTLFSEPHYHHSITPRLLPSPLKTRSDIDKSFDIITYKKAGSVLRMIEHIIGVESFKSAIRNYLDVNNIEGRTVESDDFYKALEEQGKKSTFPLPPDTTITEVVKTWTEHEGYPLIKVARDASTSTGKYIIEQETYNTERAKKAHPNREWIVPISCTTQSKKNFDDTKPMGWSFAEKALTLEIDEQSNSEWIICNIQQTGYYRVLYEKPIWQLLTNELIRSHESIGVLNRNQLVDDVLSLAEDGKLFYETALKLATYLKEESDMLPWSSALRHFNYLYSLYEETSLQEKLKKYILSILIHQYHFTEAKGEDNLIRNRRSSLLNLACKLGYADCLQNTVFEYQKNINQLDNVPANLKGVVYCYAFEESENPQTVWEQLWSLYRSTKIAYDKNTILGALGCTKDETILETYLSKLVNTNDKDLRKQDHPFVLQAITSTPAGLTTAIKFVQNKLKDADNQDENVIASLQSIVNGISGKVHSESKLSQLHDLQEVATKQNQEKYGDLTESIKSAYNEGLRIKEFKEKKQEELAAALDAETDTPPATSESPTVEPTSDTTELPTDGTTSIEPSDDTSVSTEKPSAETTPVGEPTDSTIPGASTDFTSDEPGEGTTDATGSEYDDTTWEFEPNDESTTDDEWNERSSTVPPKPSSSNMLVASSIVSYFTLIAFITCRYLRVFG